jgi:hypothetical protein
MLKKKRDNDVYNGRKRSERNQIKREMERKLEDQNPPK